MNLKLGSLFDGSGGFPLAGAMCGIEPVWAAEIEPYPISVTRSRFPNMKHLGSITNVNGAEIEPVDVITFGSPCQDLSVAGKRAGLKHEDNGDEETTRSGLFMEAVRIIREMREKTNGEYPRFAVWENVPGAFSSNKGEDFRIVLEELIKVVEQTTTMPEVPTKGWAYADSFCGDDWSIAYRVFDAQYWGVPQRRRRIYLVADFRGQCAGEILFEREGLRGYFTQSGTQRETVTGDSENCVGTADREKCVIPYTLKIRSGCEGGGKGALIQDDLSATLATNNDQYLFQPVTYDARGNGDGVICNTITGDHENRITDYTSVVVGCCIDGDKIGKAEREGGSGLGIRPGDKMYTLTAKDRHGVAYSMKSIARNGVPLEEQANPICASDWKDPDIVAYTVQNFMGDDIHGVVCCADHPTPKIDEKGVAFTLSARDYKNPQALVAPPQYIVRRLTPTECARLQGFPDCWGHPDKKDDFTDEEYRFWLDVRNTHAEINSKQTKEYTKPQMLTWYNKLHTDSSEYKMWGNGIALPNALYVMQGITDCV